MTTRKCRKVIGNESSSHADPILAPMNPDILPPHEFTNSKPPAWVLVCALLLGVINATALTLDALSH
jgi:hypothetical protein